ncbi:hypothetical protein FHS83_001135 [Rhizomicrobium palustre]|uniref:Uncharacterized protein n=1 Tax=Rhizomicrobium palustre TaxID=189966 RepID=A0A846MXW5_9PROT|nr:hypothetical protein [Rhizomicrobium palustre]NIK87817.1 hypothetical protein [Rhizomicrobium palustre]
MDPAALAEIRQKSHRASLVTGAGAAIIIGALAFAVFTVRQATVEVDRLNAQKAHVSDEITNLEAAKKRLLAENKALTAVGAETLGIAQQRSVTASQVVQGLKADKLAQTVASGQGRAPVTVTFYAKNFEKDLNQKVVFPKLSNLGYAVQVVPGRGYISRVGTNAVWFGRDVPLAQVKQVALTLIAAGVSLKTIRQFSDPGRKTSIIEVGADAAFVNAPQLSAEAVAAAESFGR